MGITESILLGIVQGLTEFLPVSSSGHLVLAEALLGVGNPTAGGGVAFEVAVHLGTLLSVLVFFRRRILEILTGVLSAGQSSSVRSANWQYIGFIVIGTIPAAIIGLLAKDHIESLFDQPRYAAAFLIVTGAFLLSTRFVKAPSLMLSLPKSFLIGIAQAFAILPGISRSGATISAGLFSGVRSERACEFSFLLSIPAILGATVLTLPDAWSSGALGIEHLVAGTAAAIVGYFALRWVFASIRTGRFSWFGFYCLAVGIVALIWLW